MATRMQADQDVNIINNVMVNRLDPSSKDSVGAKMIIDATRPLEWDAERILLPEEAVSRAQQILKHVNR